MYVFRPYHLYMKVFFVSKMKLISIFIPNVNSISSSAPLKFYEYFTKPLSQYSSFCTHHSVVKRKAFFSTNDINHHSVVKRKAFFSTNDINLSQTTIISDRSKLKEFVDDDFKFDKNRRKFFKQVKTL